MMDKVKKSKPRLTKARALVLSAAVAFGVTTCDPQKSSDALGQPPMTTAAEQLSAQGQPKQNDMLKEMFERDEIADAQEEIDYILYGTTAVFEGSYKEFFAKASTTDGLSIGLIQLNASAGAQTLNRAVKYMFDEKSGRLKVTKEVLGKDFETIKDIFFSKTPEEIEAFFKKKENYSRYSDVLAKLIGKTQEGIEYQVADINDRLTKAQEICNEYNLTSVRALAYTFDKVVHYGYNRTQKNFEKILGPIHNKPLDLINSYNNYFWPKYSKLHQTNQAEYINVKYNFIVDMCQSGKDPNMKTLRDYYLLNQINDHFSKTMIDKDKRGGAILAVDAEKTNTGWRHGGYANGSFFEPNNEILNRDRINKNYLVKSNFGIETNKLAQTKIIKGYDRTI